jgi:hypothetical protein
MTVIKDTHSHGVGITHSVIPTWPQAREPMNHGSIPNRSKTSVYPGSEVYPDSYLLGTRGVAK